MSEDWLGPGARHKERSSRTKQTIDYKAMHDGRLFAGTDCDETGSYASARGKEGARAATASDLGHEGEQEKLLSDLDREIEELETSLNEVSSQLKQASLKKEKKQPMDRLDKLRQELFVAEQQLRKTEEKGELKTEKSRKCVTKRSVAKPSKVKTKDSEAKLSTKTVKFPKPSDVSLTELRALPSLNAEVSEQLSALGLQSESSESDRSSHDSDSDSDSDSGHEILSKSKKKTLQSGLYKKSADTVKFPQIWPHSTLQFEFVSESVSFMSLDIKMFVAGELEIVLSWRISASEKLGRLKLLKKIMYFSNIYKWHAMLKFYAAWIRRIEIGLNKWSDESNEIETPMLARFPLKGRVQTKK